MRRIIVLVLIVLVAGGAVLAWKRARKNASKHVREGEAAQKEPLAAAPAASEGLSAGALPGLPESAYQWKISDVFRFQYFKSIAVRQSDENGKSEERVTEVNGVLVLEIRNAAASGTTATLRLDSSGVALPEVVVFASQSNASETQPKKNTTVARAIAGALKAARWNVVLGANGLVYIESRTPEKLSDWLKETEVAAGWRKKYIDVMPRIIENDLGFKAPSQDRDVLFYTGSVPPAPNKSIDGLRPRREVVSVSRRDEDKLVIAFRRGMPKEQAAYLIPDLPKDEIVTVKLVQVAMQAGEAVFDKKIGMLDSLNEDYTVSLNYVLQPSVNMAQEVRVRYRLERLAPPVVKP